MNAITESIKYKLGFAEEGKPTPEILKNYMDVSNNPPADHPLHCSGPQHNVTCRGTHLRRGETCQPPTIQEGKGGRDVDPIGQIHAPPWLSEWLPKGVSHYY